MRPRQRAETQVKLLLSVDEAAQALCLGRSYVYDLLRKRQVEGIRIGRQWRVSVTALERYIEQQTTR